MDKETLLYSYFSNNLTPDQERHFEKLLETDKEFKERFLFEKDLQRAIRDKKNQDLKAKLIDFENEIGTNVRKSRFKGRFRNWSIAASIVVLIGVGWLGYNTFFRTDYNNLYKSNFEQYPNTVYTITRGDDDESVEREAFVAYETGDFEKALLGFGKIEPENRRPYIEFYRAQSYLNLNKYSMAEEILKSTIANNKTFVAESHWYLALVYLKTGKIEAAKKELQILVEDHDYKKEAAITLLDQLD